MNKSGNPRSCAKLKSATAKAEFNDERRALRRVLQPTQAHAWRIYLQSPDGHPKLLHLWPPKLLHPQVADGMVGIMAKTNAELQAEFRRRSELVRLDIRIEGGAKRALARLAMNRKGEGRNWLWRREIPAHNL